MNARKAGCVALVGGVLAVLVTVAWLAITRLEDGLRQRIEAGAARHGVTVHMDALRIRPWSLLAIDGLRLDKPGVGTLNIESIAVAPRLMGLRVAVGRSVLTAPAEVTIDLEPTLWDVAAGRLHATLRAPVTGLELEWMRNGQRQRIDAHTRELRAGAVLTIRRAGLALIDPGLVSGAASFDTGAETITFEAELRGSGTRAAALANGNGSATTASADFGAPADVAIAIEAHWSAQKGRLEVPRWRVASSAATLSGLLQLAGLPEDPEVNLSLQVERVDFASLFRASGLDEPLGVGGSAGTGPAVGSLGSVALQASARGRLADAASFSVSQSLDFTPPRRPPPALEKLRGDFVHVVRMRTGNTRTIEVASLSPDFVALAEVPPLFVRTLLIGEDAAFYGHPGVDLRALPEALVTNWQRGGAVRGASTITQQLAKNLFLSNDRRLGRKVQELCLALLLEATLDKSRILEIYLNVIEWGPDLFGLRPAARHYFGREPQELTPRQIAFLVALIPGPVKYQRSFADGTPSPAFLRLVDNLLAKLRSVDALSEDAYLAALAEPLVVASLEAGPRRIPPDAP